MRPLDLTASGIIRALSGVDDAVRGKAEAVAQNLARRGVEARVEARGEGHYAVVASGTDLFSREYGSVNRQPEGLLEEAVQSLKTGGAT